MLSTLAFSGRHADQSVWILTQKYNAVLTDFREQTRWCAVFHTKDRDSFDECLRENYVIDTREERDAVRKQLAETRHSKPVLKTDQPTAYWAETCGGEGPQNAVCGLTIYEYIRLKHRAAMFCQTIVRMTTTDAPID